MKNGGPMYLLQEIAQQATDQLFAVFTANAVDGGFGDLHKGIVLDALFPLLGFLLFLLLLSLALGLLLLFLLGLALGPVYQDFVWASPIRMR